MTTGATGATGATGSGGSSVGPHQPPAGHRAEGRAGHPAESRADHRLQEERADAGWQLGRRFMLRAAGLPIETVRELRCTASRRWADEVLAESERLTGAAARISDLLYELVAPCAEDADRRALLRLRREVWANRLPRDPEADRALVSRLDVATGEEVARWLADRGRLQRRLDDGERLLAEDLRRTRAGLRRLAGEERLRNGLLLASPSLDAQLDAFVRSAPDRPDKRLRKTERSLLAYLYRTACKTSPFSTFTGVQLGEFTDSPPRPGRTIRLDDTWHRHPRLNVAVLHRLAEALIADPVRRADLPVALASGWGREQDRVRYVRRWVTAGDEDTAVTFDSVQDRLFFLRRSGTLERLLALFEQRPVLRYGELVRWLAEDRQAAEDDCERYLQALLDVGMVQVPQLRTGVHDTDPLRAFQDALRALDRPWAGRLADELDGPAAGIEGCARSAPEERRALLEQVRSRLRTVQEGLGAERAKVPQTVLYEDAAAGSVTAGDLAAWAEPAAGPLRRVEQVLPAFDLTLPQRITFQGFFTARFGKGGRCTDLLKLVHDFHEDFFDQYLSFTSRRTSAFDADGRYLPEENWLGLPQLKALDTARIAFHERMRALWDTAADSTGHGAEHGTEHGTEPGTGHGTGHGTDELVIDEALLAEVAAELDPVRPGFAPLSHHLQLAERDGDPLLVLNRSYGGLSFPFSRFTHCFDGGSDQAWGAPDGYADQDGAEGSLSERLRRHAARIQPAGAVFAEVTGGPVTSNLNLHGRLTDYEIVCPGERGSLPEEYRLNLDDLFIEHDEEADRLVLRSRRLACEVIPVYLGYLVPLALPEIPRTLLLLSPTSMAPLDVWAGIGAGEPDEGVTRRPRVRHGCLVLSRRSWSAAAEALPLRGPGTGDAQWFLDWQRWRRRHRLPDRVFATVTDRASRGATGAKPQYLDFDSALSLTSFEALLKSPQAKVTFREMLPGEDELHTVSARGTHVAELAVETVAASLGRERIDA